MRLSCGPGTSIQESADRLGGDLFAVGFGDEDGLVREHAVVRIEMAGGDDDGDVRPSAADQGSEFEPVHGARHPYVREQNPDVRPAQKNILRGVGIGGLDHFETGVFERISRRHSNEGLILHKEDDRSQE
jgi:hypothetical protein